MKTPSPDTQHERGAGTVLGLALGGVVMALLLGLLLLAQAGVTASRAASAADLAALAAADAARGLTSGEPCAVAADVASKHNAKITFCTVAGGDVVEVGTELAHPFQWGVAAGRARAGPPP
ncbi:Rv3654c family TadE-like protein [Arthrobacter sp. ISL-95]|uniref:Rv3654c family TadE-like protein n=1 Tax=Arthrobacter sp. ISL-95 TaxID=2819116 RepID=UPI001BE6A4A5|nr:Rv3654c family TadE-like protein [Arthrobacter sp. ISL-95]MBT2585470.1 flp pilus-assembly TadE/G-like family protein [Arthrobacter sp. ISL-95]